MQLVINKSDLCNASDQPENITISINDIVEITESGFPYYIHKGRIQSFNFNKIELDMSQEYSSNIQTFKIHELSKIKLCTCEHFVNKFLEE